MNDMMSGPLTLAFQVVVELQDASKDRSESLPNLSSSLSDESVNALEE